MTFDVYFSLKACSIEMRNPGVIGDVPQGQLSLGGGARIGGIGNVLSNSARSNTPSTMELLLAQKFSEFPGESCSRSR